MDKLTKSLKSVTSQIKDFQSGDKLKVFEKKAEKVVALLYRVLASAEIG